MTPRQSRKLRALLKKQREFRAEETKRHLEELAEWIAKRGPLPVSLRERLNIVN